MTATTALPHTLTPVTSLSTISTAREKASLTKRRYTFTKDTFVLVKPGTIHSECSDKNASVLFVGFTTDYDSLTEGIYSVNTAPVRELMDEILRERENKRPYYKSMLNLLVEKLVLLLLRFPINDRVEKVSFDDILTYIKMNANKNISIQQMASDLGYSYDYFRQFFIEHAGVSSKKISYRHQADKRPRIVAVNRFFGQQNRPHNGLFLAVAPVRRIQRGFGLTRTTTAKTT